MMAVRVPNELFRGAGRVVRVVFRFVAAEAAFIARDLF
jgi:hypothetical protein